MTIYKVLFKCTDLFQFAKYSKGDGYHHSGGCCISDPHGYESSYGTKATKQLCVAAPKCLHYDQSDPQMQVAMLSGDSKYQTTDKDHDGIIHIASTCLLSAKDTE